MTADDKPLDLHAQASRAVVEILEHSRTTSAGVLRKKVYGLLDALGVDVGGLVSEARDRLKADHKRKAKHHLRRKQINELRLQEAGLSESDKAKARLVLASTPRLIRTHKQAIEEIVNRPVIGPTDPTRERLAHAVEPLDEVRIQPLDERWTLVKRASWPVDRIAPLLSGPEYEAAEQYLWAYLNRSARPKVSNYDGVGDQRDPARRLPLTPTQQRAGLEWEMWERRVPRALQPILDNFVLELAPRGHDQPLSRVDFGKRWGHCKDTHQARGIADGMLKVALSVLAAIWRDYQDWLDAQRARVKAAANIPYIRDLIAAGALDDAVREIQAETREREARSARGVAPGLALGWVQTAHVQGQVFKPRVEQKRGSD